MARNRRVPRAPALALIGGLIAALSASPLRAETPAGSVTKLHVAAAASTIAPLNEAIRTFTTEQNLPAPHRIEIVPIYASSGALARQIVHGSPAQIFISANKLWLDVVSQERGLAVITRQTLVGNALVLAAPTDSALKVTLTPGVDLAGALKGGRLVTADPAHAPLGQYAEAALKKLGAWQAIEGRLLRAGDAAQARVLVERGAAAAGILYASDIAGNTRLRVVARFPREISSPPLYEIAMVGLPDAARYATAARAFMDWLLGPKGQAIFARHGFVPAIDLGR